MGRFVHRQICKSIGVGVPLAGHVLVSHTSDSICEQSGAAVERLEPVIPDFVDTAHLLHEEQRVGAHVQFGSVVVNAPCQRRKQALVLGDVVRRVRNGAVQLGQDLAGR